MGTSAKRDGEASRSQATAAVARATPRAKVEQGRIESVQADAIIVNLFEGVTKPAGATGAVDAATGGALSTYISRAKFKGEFKETAWVFPDGLGAPRVLLVGLGKKADLTLDRVRQVAARAAKTARDHDVKRLATIVHGAGIGGLKPRDAAQAVVEGSLLALYKFETYKSEKGKREGKGGGEPAKVDVEELVLVSPTKAEADAFRDAVHVGTVIADSVNLTRTVATLSGHEAIPANIVEHATRAAKDAGLDVKVLSKKEIEAEGMGCFLAVNQGSAHEPRFVVLEHKPPASARRRSAPHGAQTLVLVGKGITFDSGGLSIKPSDKMDEMKFDKSGAAAVWGALRAAAMLRLPLHVVGLTPLTENVIGPAAVKPGDVARALDGTTVEILNTDAEGRLVLADALAYAARYDPDAVIDLATLTGAMVVATGGFCTGIMGNDKTLLARVIQSGDRVHERCAAMPFFDEYGEVVKGKNADLKNHFGRPGSAITAGKFLEHFVPTRSTDGTAKTAKTAKTTKTSDDAKAEQVAWVHMDIAGTAWHDGGQDFNAEYTPTQATGVGVRLLVDLMTNWKPLPRRAK
ncbi:MAG: leucyl aminopeptidase family protein [Thermoplasmatota archaeon]